MTRIWALVLLSLLSVPGAFGQELHLANLGDFKLESGDTIQDCHIGYRTFGKLNDDRSNAILFLTCFGCTSEDMASVVPHLGLEKYYVIVVDALGNGVSSSPSNSRLQARMNFPQYTVRDMVNSQHDLLIRQFGIEHLKAVMGISMGAIQAFQWMVAYPEFMDDAISLLGAPRLAPYSLLHLKLGIDLIMKDPAWKNGDYDAPFAGTTSIELADLVLTTPAYFDAHTNRDQIFQQIDQTAAAGAKSGKHDANDKIRTTQALLRFDLSAQFGGSMVEAAERVRARTLIVVSKSDHTVTPGPALDFAQLMHAQTLVLDDDCGHNAVNCDSTRVTDAIHDLLDANDKQQK